MRRGMIRTICVLAVCVMAFAMMPITANAAPKKCPNCKKAYTYQTTIKTYTNKWKTNRRTVWKQAIAPCQNGSNRPKLMGAHKGDSTTVKWSASGGISWSVLKLSGSYTKSDTKTAGYVIQDWVPAKYWCCIKFAHKVDDFKIQKRSEKKCIKCGHTYQSWTNTYKASVPVKSSFVFDHRVGKTKKSVQ